MPSFPLSPESWTILMALGVILAGGGWEYRHYRRRRAAYEGPHWTDDIAYAAVVAGRVAFFAAVIFFMSGGVQGGLHP